MRYDVYYSKDCSRSYSMKKEDITKELVSELYVHLMQMEAEGLENVFWKMQGENWSPNGEARELIRSKGLSHTSMSIGDIVVEDESTVYLCASLGFVELPFSAQHLFGV